MLSSCGATIGQTDWKSSYSPEDCADLTSLEAIEERCGEGDFDRAMELMATDITQCLPYSSPIEMQGVWVTGFEHSAFYEGAQTYADVVVREGDIVDKFIWLSVSDLALEQLPPASQRDQAFRVEMLGRKSLCQAHYGHLGVAPHEVIATDFHVLTLLPTTPN
jgi:hypothetical protein